MEEGKKKRYGKRQLRKKDLEFISEIAGKALRINGISEQDIPDIEHDLVLVLARRIHHFNPEVNTWDAFRAVVVQHALTDILRKHTGPDSYYSRMADFTLDDPVPGSKRSDPVFYRDLVNSDGLIADGTEKAGTEAANLRMDVRDAIASMPRPLRKMCHAIMLFGNNKAQIAEYLGVERRTVRIRFAEIKNVLIRLGFRSRF